MQEKLIEPDALNLAIKMGAGVFRETARIIQIAADCAIENEKKRITIHDVQRAVREIRSDFKRILKSDDYTTLTEVYKNNEIRGIEKIGHLLHNLSILEYVNDETWCDVHPTLEAPDFFAFRNRVVEFMDSPAEKEFTPALTAFALETEYRSHTEIERSIALKEKLLSELSTETEISGYLLSSLATLYRTIGDYQKSIDCSEKALKIGLAVFGDKHPNVATEYNNIGEAWRMLGDAEKAIAYYNNALEIATVLYGINHPSTKSVQNNIDALQRNSQASKSTTRIG